ncbi:MAG TPA: class I SAM-dependent methyltransferase [Burkholderiales bacterium]|nr:class I SAM-dependent methyltransferase [Burkholderiales bacterium]
MAQASAFDVEFEAAFPGVTQREKDRLVATLDAIPSDAKRALEVGFLELGMTRLLDRRLDLVSIDLPLNKSLPKEFKLAYASIEGLPFADRHFDIIVCTEVLEHLPEQTFRRGIRELERVSARYLLVSVPYRQRVWNEYYKCSHCGYVGNSMNHLRYFDEKSVGAMFPEFSLTEQKLIGDIAGYAPDFLYRLARSVGNVWATRTWKCSNCKKMPEEIRPNLFGAALRRVIWRLEKAAPKRKCWSICLLERRVAT